jgi:hypothetical protein
MITRWLRHSWIIFAIGPRKRSRTCAKVTCPEGHTFSPIPNPQAKSPRSRRLSCSWILSDVHERAFPEIIAAFRAQVKHEDISDRAKVDTLRLKLLSVVLKAADFVAPVQKAMADIVHVASGRSQGDKK